MTTWLIDKSALLRLAESPDASEWAARIERGLVRITTVTRLETGYSARSGPEMRAGFQRPPLSSMPVEYLTPAIEDRAVGWQLRPGADAGSGGEACLSGRTGVYLLGGFEAWLSAFGSPGRTTPRCRLDRRHRRPR